MRISDWSSDVCSSDLLEIGAVIGARLVHLERLVDGLLRALTLDLHGVVADLVLAIRLEPAAERAFLGEIDRPFQHRVAGRGRFVGLVRLYDRKSVVLGKSVSELADVGGWRYLKTKITHSN